MKWSTTFSVESTHWGCPVPTTHCGIFEAAAYVIQMTLKMPIKLLKDQPLNLLRLEKITTAGNSKSILIITKSKNLNHHNSLNKYDCS